MEYFPKEVHKAVPAYSFASKNASERKPENRPSKRRFWIGMDSMGFLGDTTKKRTEKKDENDIDIDFYRLK